MAQKQTRISLQRNIFEKKIDVFVDEKEVVSIEEDIADVIEEEELIVEIEKKIPLTEEVIERCNLEEKIKIVNVRIEVDKYVYTIKSIPYKQIYVDHNKDIEFINRFKKYLSSIKEKSKIKIIEVIFISDKIGLETLDKKHESENIKKPKRVSSKGVQRKTKKDTL